MRRNTRELRALARLAEAWGGKLQALPPDAKHWDRIHPRFDAPFTHYRLSISWKEKTIFYDEEEVHWCDVIHEMAHVFGCRVPPRASMEIYFLGFEMALVRKIKGSMRTWWNHNGQYGVGSAEKTDKFPFPKFMSGEIGGLSPNEKRKLARWARMESHARGLLDAHGAPTPVR